MNFNNLEPVYNKKMGFTGQFAHLNDSPVNMNLTQPIEGYEEDLFALPKQPILGPVLNDFDSIKMAEESAKKIGLGEKPHNFGNVLNPVEETQKEGLFDFFKDNINGIGGGYSLESALFGLGRSLGRHKWSEDPDVARSQKRANALMGIGSAGKLLIGGARSLFSGKGYANRNDWVLKDYEERDRKNRLKQGNTAGTYGEVLNNYNRTGVLYAEEGGYVPEFESGGYYSKADYIQPINTTVVMQEQALRNAERRALNKVTDEDINDWLDKLYERKGYDNSDIFSNASADVEEHSHDDHEHYDSINNSNSTSVSEVSEQSVGAETSNTGSEKIGDNKETKKKPEIKRDSIGNIIVDFKQGQIDVRGKKGENTFYWNGQPLKHDKIDNEHYRVYLGNNQQRILRNEGKKGWTVNGIDYFDKVRSTLIKQGGDTKNVVKQIGTLNVANDKRYSDLITQIGNGLRLKKDTNGVKTFVVNKKSFEDLNEAINYAKSISGSKFKDLIPHLEDTFELKHKSGWFSGGDFYLNNGRKVYTWAEGGQQPVSQEGLIAELEQAVANGDVTEEEAVAYLQEVQQSQQVQQDGEGGDLITQLEQAVSNGDMTPEEAQAYLMSVQEGQNGQIQEHQITPEQAQAQLSEMVARGEVSEEEALTYLEQMFGPRANSNPIEPYVGEMKDKMTPEEYMTGEYAAGNGSDDYNAEVEAGEYLHRNGVTQEVVGNKHSRGGEKMNLEKGTIIISDKGKLGSANARALSLELGIKLKAGDTYAQVLDIYTKKIGLEDLNKEQQELFKTLRKVEGEGSKRTQELNQEFLNRKINEIEQKKQSMLEARNQVTKILFEMQETEKQMKSESENFANGGFIPKFSDGGKSKNPPITLSRPGMSIEEIEAMNNAIGSNKIDTTKGINQWQNVFYDPFNAYYKEIGKDAVDFQDHLTYQKEIVSHLNPQLRALYEGDVIPLTNRHRNLLKGTGFEKAKYLSDVTDSKVFDKLGGKNRFIESGYLDGIAGHRGINVRKGDLTKEEASKLTGKYDNLRGTHFYMQYDKDGNPLRDENGALLLYYPIDVGKQPETTPQPQPESKDKKSLAEKVAEAQGKRRSNAFFLPDQSILPPEGLRPVPKQELRLNYLDRSIVSPEQGLMENYRNFVTAKDKLESLPDNIRVANIGQLAGNTSLANNQLVGNANGQNLQSDLQVRGTNLQQMGRQGEIDLKLNDQYDTRMNKAMDVTRKDLEGYFDFNRKVAIGDFNTRHQMELLNQLYENYGVGTNGLVRYDGSRFSPYEISEMDRIKLEQIYDAINKNKSKGKTEVTTKNDGTTTTKTTTAS